MRSILSLLAFFLTLQGGDAFVPRPATSGIVAPWGVVELSNANSALKTASNQKQTLHPRLLQPVLKSHAHSVRAPSLKASSGVDSRSSPAKIIIAGAPASGKGTQCEKIKEKFGVVHLSTGDMLRAAVSKGTDVGREAKAYMDSGKLVPDSTIIGVVRVVEL